MAYAIGKAHANITCVEATWTQPKVTCTKSEQAFAIWISIDGWTSNHMHVKVPSPRTVAVGTETECVDGRPVISPWHMANPVDTFEYNFGLTTLDAVVGDIIWAQIRFANGAFTMALRDKTKGTQVKMTQVVPKIARVVAIWEVSSVFTNCATKCRETPLAKFSPITFSSVQATMGGKRVAVGGASIIEVVEDATKKGVKRMVVSRIGASGRSFTVTWKHI